LREHVIQEARIHYIIEKGGEQPNIVPAYARSWYYIRAPEWQQVKELYNRVLNIAKGAAMMTETRMEVRYLEGIYNLLPNRVLAELVVKNMREIGPPEYTEKELEFAREIAKTIPPEQKREALRKSKRPDWEELLDVILDRSVPDPWGEGEIMYGSTDVGDVSWQAPTLEFSTATCVLGTPGHSWQFTAQCGSPLGHKSLIFASKVLAASVLALMTREELLKKAWDEFRKRRAGREYEPPIPPDLKPPLDLWSEY